MRRVCWLLAFPLAGCLPLTEERTTLVGGNPFNHAPHSGVMQANYAPGSKEVGQRVLQVGDKLVAANPQLGCRPVFATIGSPRLELFHMDGPAVPAAKVEPGKEPPPAVNPNPVIYVTEGLVKRCPTDIELSAVLSFEIGRVLSQREVTARKNQNQEDKLPPIQVPIGNAGSSAVGPDLTGLAELAKFEKKYPKARKSVPPPDPRKIATDLLSKAGFPETALESVTPLLEEADHNAALERQLKGGAPQGWSPE